MVSGITIKSLRNEMLCQAHIIKENKRTKADSCKPTWKEYDAFPPCHGKLQVFIGLDEDDKMTYRIECSRCKEPWHLAMVGLRTSDNGELDITSLLMRDEEEYNTAPASVEVRERKPRKNNSRSEK